MNKRIEWIDALRGLGILLVVIGHLKPSSPVERYIYSFHMFLFFAVSGFLFREEKNMWSFIKKKSKRLLLPYSFWTLLVSLSVFLSGAGLKSAVKTFIMYNGSIGWNRPLWFLMVLFISEVIYALLKKCCRFSNWILLLICPWIWYMLEGQRLTLKLEIVPVSLFFLAFGNILKSLLNSKYIYNKHKKWICGFILSGSAFVHVICGVHMNKRIVFTLSKFGRYDICLLAGMAGVIFFFFLFQLAGDNKLLRFFSKHSLFIMCSHYYILHLISRISLPLFGHDLWNERSSIKAVLLGIIIVSVLSVFGEILLQKSKDKPCLQTCFRWIGI